MSPAEETEKPDWSSASCAVDHEAAGAGGDVGEIDRGAEPARLAEHHVAVAGIVRVPAAGAVGSGRPDDQVVEAVAVDVARPRRPSGRTGRPHPAPWITKPPVPAATVARSIAAPKPPAWPNTT